MRFFRAAAIAAFVLGGAADAALAQTRGETDGCLVSLYNYPAGTPRSRAEAKSPPRSPAALAGKRGAGETGGRAPAGRSLRARSRAGD